MVKILPFYTWSVRCFVHVPQNTLPAKRACGMWALALELVKSTAQMIAARSDITDCELGVAVYEARPDVASFVTPLRLVHTIVKPDNLLRSALQQTTDINLFALCRDCFSIRETSA